MLRRMSAPLLFIIAILTPLMLAVSMFVPAYAGIFGAAHLVYAGGTHPQSLLDKAGDVFYIINVYSHLFTYWSGHMMQVSFLRFTLPLFTLPMIGIFVSYWITRRLVRGLRHLSHLTTSV